MAAPSNIKIVAFNESLKPWFGKLNRVWLERYFEVEEIDRLVLDYPEQHVLDHGGHILFAVQAEPAQSGSRQTEQERSGHVLGTCALKHHGDKVYELTKMAVADEAQGLGVGRLLLNACVKLYREVGGARLFLESHHSLQVALKLYETGGFAHVTPDEPSPYARADVYMELVE